MRRFVFLLAAVPALFGTDLATLTDLARTNLRVDAGRLEAQKAQEQLDYAATAYFPRVGANALYKRKDVATAFEPKMLQGVELQAGMTLYDSRREAALSAARSSLQSARYTALQEEQNVVYETIIAYYAYFDAQARLRALADKRRELDAQVDRLNVLVANGLATRDTLMSLIAAQRDADYEVQNQQLAAQQALHELELLTGAPVEALQYRDFSGIDTPPSDRRDILAGRADVQTLRHSEERTTYMPTVSVQGTHRHIDYSDYDTMGGLNVQPLNQNELTATLSMTLFDMGAIRKEQEQARLETLRAGKLLAYREEKARKEVQTARLGVQTAQSALTAARAELEARKEAFDYVRERFTVGLVNATTYLTELSSLSDARARTDIARDALQTARARLAYAAGTDLTTLTKENR